MQYLTHGPHHYLFLTTLKSGIKFTSIDKRFEKCEVLREKYSQPEEKPRILPKRTARTKETKKTTNKTKDDKPKENVANTQTSNGIDESDDLKDLYVLSMTQSNGSTENGERDFVFEPCEEVCNSCYFKKDFVVS